MLAMRDVQAESGRFTDVAPMGGGFGGTLWGSAGLTVAWETYQQYGDVPESLESLGIAAQLSDGSTLAYEPEHMTLTVRTPKGDLIYTPKVDDLNQVNWACEGGEGVTANQLPPLCQPLAKD